MELIFFRSTFFSRDSKSVFLEKWRSFLIKKCHPVTNIYITYVTMSFYCQHMYNCRESIFSVNCSMCRLWVHLKVDVPVSGTLGPSEHIVPRLANMGIKSISLLKMVAWEWLRSRWKRNVVVFMVKKKKFKKLNFLGVWTLITIFGPTVPKSLFLGYFG